MSSSVVERCPLAHRQSEPEGPSPSDPPGQVPCEQQLDTGGCCSLPVSDASCVHVHVHPALCRAVALCSMPSCAKREQGFPPATGAGPVDGRCLGAEALSTTVGTFFHARIQASPQRMVLVGLAGRLM